MKGVAIITLALVFSGLITFGCAQKEAVLFSAEGADVCKEVKSGKMWQVGRGGPFSTYQEAEQYAADLVLDGYDDWRLPRKHELSYLFQSFFWKKNNSCELNRSGEYWSVTREGKPSLGHWEIYYLCDPEFKYVKSHKKSGFVRAVRP